jgi:DNA repair protein RadC
MTEPSLFPRTVLRIRDLPQQERPRERLGRLGAAALSNEELLSLLLGSGTRGESALDRARSLLAAHGGLVALAGLTGAELRRERGIKGARAAVIEAALELGRRLGTDVLAPRDLYNEPGLVKEYLRRARGDGVGGSTAPV